MLVTSAICGAVWGLIPGFFKAKWNTNETLFTLMMNYVAIQLTSYSVAKWENPPGSNSVGIINQTTQAGWMPSIGGNQYLINVIVVMVNITHNITDAAARYGKKGDYVAGANIAGFEKLVNAMLAQGIV